MDAEAMIKITEELRKVTDWYQQTTSLVRKRKIFLYLRLVNKADLTMMRSFSWKVSCMGNPFTTATSTATLRLREVRACCPRTVSLFER